MKILLLLVIMVTSVHAQLMVNKTALADTVLDAGENGSTVFSFSLKAIDSDMSFQKIQFDLGNLTSIYTKIFKTFYLMDSLNQIVDQSYLNSNTVVNDGSTYRLTFENFSVNLQQNIPANFFVLTDVYSSIKITEQGYRTISVNSFGIKAVDGSSGLDVYGPTETISQSVFVQDVSEIPEPATYVFLVGIVSSGFVLYRRKRFIC